MSKKKKIKMDRRPKFMFLTREGVELLEKNHRVKITDCLYSSGVDLNNKASCKRVLVTMGFQFNPIERHLESAIELAQLMRERFP